MRWVAAASFSLICAGCGPALDAQVRSIDNLKVRDAVSAYERARTSGAPLDRCVKAKMAALAYEDAKDPTNASAWRAREREDCDAAVDSMGIDVDAARNPPPAGGNAPIR